MNEERKTIFILSGVIGSACGIIGGILGQRRRKAEPAVAIERMASSYRDLLQGLSLFGALPKVINSDDPQDASHAVLVLNCPPALAREIQRIVEANGATAWRPSLTYRYGPGIGFPDHRAPSIP